jgi:hypothetical protein
MLHVMDFKLQFRFHGQRANITLNENTLIRNCSAESDEITDTK